MKRFLLTTALTLALILFGSVQASYAQTPCPHDPSQKCFGDINNSALPGQRGLAQQQGTTLAYYIAIFWETAFIISGLGFLAYLLIGGFRYMTAGGDAKMTGEAKNIIVHALVGLVIIASSFVVIRIIESVFGLVIVSGPIKFPTP